MPSFVTRWLMPRLGQFRAIHRQIEVRVLASVPSVEFVRDRVDVAIRLGAGPYPGWPPSRCWPSRARPTHHATSWARCFEAQGVVVSKRLQAPRLRFSHSYLTLDAATSKQGGDGFECAGVRRRGAGCAGTGARAQRRGHRAVQLHLPQSKLASAPRRPVQSFVEWLRGAAHDFRRAS